MLIHSDLEALSCYRFISIHTCLPCWSSILPRYLSKTVP